ncbi:MAG TPA: hypothetical protein VF600_08010 [Abditibacteriaceae bacterium]|jgi:hypothetical protein
MRRSTPRRFLQPFNAPPLRVGRCRIWTAARLLLASLFVLLCAILPLMREAARAQSSDEPADNGSELTVEDDAPTTSTAAENVASTGTASASATATPPPAPTAAPTAAATVAATPRGARAVATSSGARAAVATRPFGRTVILVLGGVSWEQWIAMSALTNPSTPGFRKLLEEGALAAARLPRSRLSPGQRARVDDGLQPSAVPNVSPAMLRVAASLSSGSDEEAAQEISPLSALTLSTRERLPSQFPGWEEGFAAMAYARRTMLPPPADAWLNLGVHSGAARAEHDEPGDMLRRATMGRLGRMVHGAGARTAVFGNGDTAFFAGHGSVLREWALLATDERGVVDSGDLSRGTLARDSTAPFGVRVNRRALLQRIDVALDNARGGAALLAIEWGDTRRAALYSPFCAPAIAATYRQQALRQADAFLQALMPRLNDERDRLVVLAIPDLNTGNEQWLPLVYWQPQRGGQGALWFAPGREEAPGVVRLPDITATIAARLNVSAGADQSPGGTSGVLLQEIGAPQSAARRMARLIALQAGITRLDMARLTAQAVAAILAALAMLFTLPIALRPEESASRNVMLLNRLGWRATLIYPLLLWMAGVCVELMWRSGRFLPSLSPSGDWTFSFLLLAFTLFLALVVTLAWSWFGDERRREQWRRTQSPIIVARLRATHIGVLWLLLTVFSLWVGGFAQPWNSLIGSLWPDAASLELSGNLPVRVGDFWALLLISATMLGVSSMTRVGRATQAVSARRVLNVRPAATWMILVVLLLWHPSWGRNAPAALVALFGFGTMWFRLWSERAERLVRLRRRRWLLAGVVGLGVLLLWPRSSGSQEVALLDWWNAWVMSWQTPWWSIALAATLAGAALFLSPARWALREYLNLRYSSRAMLVGTAVAALVALLLFGPAGPPLVALYTLGSVLYEALNRRVETAA